MSPRIHTSVLCCALLGMSLFSVDVSAQSPSRRARGIYGDWRVTIDFNGRQMESILAFGRDRQGKRTGYWISFWGMSELRDLTYEQGKLGFVQARKNREGKEVTSKFQGIIDGGKLTGTLSSERGELKVAGERARTVPRAAGTWETKLKMGDREFTTTLVVTPDKEGKLAVQWKSERVKHEISAVKYTRGKLTFKTKSKMQEREWESTFEGRIRGNTLSGTVKSERGELAVEGKRVGAAIIGTWKLAIASEQGERMQRLRVHPDLSALYGSIPVDKIHLDGGKVTFQVVLKFGERKFEIGFQGKLQDSKLTGELTSSRGNRKVTGTKVERRRRTPRSRTTTS